MSDQIPAIYSTVFQSHVLPLLRENYPDITVTQRPEGGAMGYFTWDGMTFEAWVGPRETGGLTKCAAVCVKDPNQGRTQWVKIASSQADLEGRDPSNRLGLRESESVLDKIDAIMARQRRADAAAKVRAQRRAEEAAIADGLRPLAEAALVPTVNAEEAEEASLRLQYHKSADMVTATLWVKMKREHFEALVAKQ